MKHVIRTVLLLVLVVGLCGVGVAQAQTKLKFAHVNEANEPYQKHALWAAEEIKNRTAGRYVIEVFPNSILGNEPEINQGIALGTLDIIWTGVPFTARVYGPMGISCASYMLRDLDHWKAYRDSALFQELADGYFQASGGSKIMGMAYEGMRQVTSNKPINRPEDMKNLKIRVPGAPLYQMFPKAMGANSVPIAFAEVYMALKTGTVDAQENPLHLINAMKFYEVNKYINLTGHMTESIVIIVGAPTWSKLSEADRKVFQEVLKQAVDRTSQDIMDKEQMLGTEFEKRGNVVNRVDRKPFRDLVIPSHMGPDATWSKAVYDRLQAIK